MSFPTKRTKHFLNGTTGVLPYFFVPSVALEGGILWSNTRKHHFQRKPAKRTKHFRNGTTGVLPYFFVPSVDFAGGTCGPIKGNIISHEARKAHKASSKRYNRCASSISSRLKVFFAGIKKVDVCLLFSHLSLFLSRPTFSYVA